MTVLNDLDRFHLVMGTIARLPQTGDRGIYSKQQVKDKLAEHRQYINEYGQDMPRFGTGNGKDDRRWRCG